MLGKFSKRRVWVLLAIVLMWPLPLVAHIQMLQPKPRTLLQKIKPCGATTVPKGTPVATYTAGETIVVSWKETVPHPGHYRISLDPEGENDLLDPPNFTALYTNPTVLLDGIADKTGTTTYSVSVTLPEFECANCTLQLIQVMTDKPPYGDGNDIYYQCADITVLKPPPGCAEPPGDVDASATLSVTDVQCAIVATLWVLGNEVGEPPACLAGDVDAADVNCDGSVNVSDITLVTQRVLGMPLDPAGDADGDQCPDSCQ